MAWKEEDNIDLRSFPRNHIDVLVNGDNVNVDWCFTGFYGSPFERNRVDTWNLLRSLRANSNFPWLVAGDFNEILFSFEKVGGVSRDERRMEAFRDMLEECNLTDVGFSGPMFTWERENLVETNIRERLDQGVANNEWLSIFPNAQIRHLPHTISDHCPLLINLNDQTWHGVKKFRFKVWWTLEDSFECVVQRAWNCDIF